MTYLFAKLAGAMFVSALVSSFLRVDYAILLGLCSAVLGIGLLFFSKKNASLIFLSVSIGAVLVISSLFGEFYPSKSLDGISAKITGKVTEVSASGGNPIYTVKTDYVGIEGAPQKIKVRISGWDENSAKPFDIISCPVVFTVYSDEDMSTILTDRSEKVSVYAYTKAPFEVIGRDESSFGYFIHLLREKISSIIYEYFIDWHAPFMEQLIIGTRGELESEISSAFRKSGMSHILAISGMHMVIIIGLLEKLSGFGKSTGKTRFIKSILLMAATGLYMFIGGLGMSVLRSGFMLIAHYFIKAVFRGSKSLDNLGIAVIIVLSASPMACCDAGFIMSVVSCASICVFSDRLSDYICTKLKIKNEKGIFRFIVDAFSSAFAASLAVLPVSAAVFGGFSPFSVFSNVFSVPFVHITLVLGFLTVLFGSVPFLGFFAGGTAFIAMISDSVIYKIADLFSGIDFAYFEISGLWVTLWMFGSALIILVPAFCFKTLRYIPYSAAFSLSVLAICIAVNFICGYGTSKVEVTAFEHGTAVSCSKDGKSVLITHALEPNDRFKLRSDGTDFDILILLDSSESAEFDLVSVSDPEKAYLSSPAAAGKYDFASAAENGSIALWEGAFAEIISNGVFCADFGGTSLLYISEECDIMNIAPNFRRADIIIFDGVSPADYPILRCEYMILRQLDGFYSGTTELITLKNGNIVFYAYEGNIQKGRFA